MYGIMQAFKYGFVSQKYQRNVKKWIGHLEMLRFLLLDNINMVSIRRKSGDQDVIL
jgi:hypothetical protein